MNAGTAQKPKRMKALAALAACTVLILGLTGYGVRGRYFIYDVQEHINLGVENPGVSLDLVELQNTILTNLSPQGRAMPSLTAIRVQTPKRVFWLKNLGELRGDVTIRNADDALKYVRLATNDEAYFAKLGKALEIHRYPPDDRHSVFSEGIPSKSGYRAMVHDADYKKDGFAPATVSQSGGTYHVRRWVWIIDDSKPSNVQLWDESVDPHGAYTCNVLISKPAPTNHGEVWSIPFLK